MGLQKEQQEKEQKKKDQAQQQRNHQRKLKELGKKIGTVSQELYNNSLARLQDNTYVDESLRNRDRNIIDLYGIQQQFEDKIDMDSLDAI